MRQVLYVRPKTGASSSLETFRRPLGRRRFNGTGRTCSASTMDPRGSDLSFGKGKKYKCHTLIAFHVNSRRRDRFISMVNRFRNDILVRHLEVRQGKTYVSAVSE